MILTFESEILVINREKSILIGVLLLRISHRTKVRKR
jgi:hypothetical protein